MTTAAELLMWLQRLAIQRNPYQDPIPAIWVDGKPPYRDWDKAARQWWAAKVKGAVHAGDLAIDLESDFFVEHVCGVKLTSETSASFFGSPSYPDSAIRCGSDWVAIELDHGDHGARLRTALTKAEFNVRTRYERCYVLFFDESETGRLSRALSELSETDRKILTDYQERGRTWIVRFRDRKCSQIEPRAGSREIPPAE